MAKAELIELARQLVIAAEGAEEYGFEGLLIDWAEAEGRENGPGVNLHAYRNAILDLKAGLDRVVRGLKEGIAEYHAEIEACPGCGALPGDGYTPGCNHENGCGYGRLQEATPHDRTMAGV